MDLMTLAVVVVGGIVGVVGLTIALGWSTPAMLTEASARAHYLAAHPRASLSAVRVDDRGRAALLVDGDAVGVVSVLGDRAVTRRLVPGGVAVAEDGEGLTLRLVDFGAPTLVIALGDTDSRTRWRQRLSGAV